MTTNTKIFTQLGALRRWGAQTFGSILSAATGGVLALLLLAPAPAFAQGRPPGCTGSGLGILLFTDAGDTHIGDTIRYSVTVLNGAATGPLVCDASDITAFVVTPDGVSHPVNLRRTLLRSGESDYYTNVVAYVVRSQDIQTDGTVRATASDTGVIWQNDTPSQGGANQGVNTEISQPCIRLEAVCVAGVGESGLITFTGTLLNCGNNTLYGVTITNSVNGGLFEVTTVATLTRGQSVTFSGSWVPANPCVPSSAILVATALDGVLRPRTVTSSATVTCSNALTPGIRIAKVCPVAPVAPGQLLTFTGSITNTGNVTLTNLVVVNNRPVAGTRVFTLASLAPGASATFSGSYLAPTNCTVADTLNVTAASVCGAAVADAATATCPIFTTPRLEVTAVCPVTPVLPGGVLTYTGMVRNTGDVQLNNLVVISDRPVAGTRILAVASLAPGASVPYTASVTVPPGACAVTTQVSASAKDACSAADASNSTSVTCQVVTAPAIAVTLTCPPGVAAAGGPITYSGTVRNSGNVALSGVVVRGAGSAQDPVYLTLATLAPGASSPFAATFAAPADACTFLAAVTASGADACSSTPVSATATATCPLATVARLVVTQECPVAPSGLGGVLTYTGSVRNTGDVTLTNIVVTSDRTGSTPVWVVATLAPGATEQFTGSYTVPANSGCSITATLSASASSRCTGARISATAPATCPVVGAPNLAITLTCPVAPTPLGGVVTFTGTLRNTGNITLTNVVVRRDGSDTPVLSVATLAAGASRNFSGSFAAPAADACSVGASVSASANDQCGGVSVAASAVLDCPLVTAPRLVVAQFCPTVPGSPGSLVPYSGSVSNAGNVTLTNIVVLGSHPAPNTVVFTLDTLAPGASAPFSHTATAALDACSISSTLSASGRDRCNGVVASHAVTTVCPLTVSPALVVTRDCPAGPVLEGTSLVYTGSVMNTGNVTLTNVLVFSSQPVANTRVLGPITLAPGAMTNFTGSYTAPLNVCSSTDTLTATGRDRCLAVSVTNSATGTCPILTVPRIGVSLACPTVSPATGAPITYSGFVRNLGNVTLNNVTVVDTGSSPSTVFSVPTLAPGASAAFTTTFASTPGSCSIGNTVVATGADACGSAMVSATATATCPLVTTPRLVVTQECPPTAAALGGLVFYNGSVRNTGDVTLTNVTVTSDRSGSTPVFAVETLAPGASAPFTGSFTAPADSVCTVTSTLIAAGFDPCTGGRVSANTTTTCPLTTAPSIVVTQSCPTNTVEPGSLLRYTGTIRNTGNVALTNIVVVSSRPASNTVVFTASVLAPGASTTFTGAYAVPVDCCVVSSTVRVSAQPFCPGPAVEDSFTATCTVSGTPSIAVTKVCPVNTVKPGEPMDFRGTVRNTGSVTLIDVTVVNNLIGPTPVLGPVTLAPGETLNYSGTYVMPADFCGPDTVTARGLSACTFAAVTDAALVPCPILLSPGIEVTKRCPVQMGFKGELFTFTGTVRNTGNVTLHEVVVMNNKPAANTQVFGPVSLAPGEAMDFTGSYMAAPCCCETIDTLTARGQGRCGTGPVMATSTVVCPLQSSPAVSITRTCPASPVPVGGRFEYSGTIRNDGDVVLTNVVVLPSFPAGSAPLLGPIELGAGETKTFHGSYTVVSGSDPAADTVTVRGQEACQGRYVSATADCSGPVLPVVRITAMTLVRDVMNVTWTSLPGAIYVLQSKPGADAAWADLEGDVTADGASTSKGAPANSTQYRIFRVRVVRE